MPDLGLEGASRSSKRSCLFFFRGNGGNCSRREINALVGGPGYWRFTARICDFCSPPKSLPWKKKKNTAYRKNKYRQPPHFVLTIYRRNHGKTPIHFVYTVYRRKYSDNSRYRPKRTANTGYRSKRTVYTEYSPKSIGFSMLFCVLC